MAASTRAEMDPKRLEAIIFEKNKRLAHLQQCLQLQNKKSSETNGRLIQENVVFKEQNSRLREERKALISTIERQKTELELLKARNDELFRIITVTITDCRRNRKSSTDRVTLPAPEISTDLVVQLSSLMEQPQQQQPPLPSPTDEFSSNSPPLIEKSPPRPAVFVDVSTCPIQPTPTPEGRFISPPRPRHSRNTNKRPTSYKEPALNSKLRKGDPHTFGNCTDDWH